MTTIESKNMTSSAEEKSEFPGVFVSYRRRRTATPSPVPSVSVSEDGLSSEACSSAATSRSSSPAPELLPVDLENAFEEAAGARRRRKKNKAVADDAAVKDPARYKTTSCKNWEKFGKCPYGPRCLFAHGQRQLRSMEVNKNRIQTALEARSPERVFHEVARFPEFMAVPAPVQPKDTETPVDVAVEIATQTSPTVSESHSTVEVPSVFPVPTTSEVPTYDTAQAVATFATPPASYCPCAQCHAYTMPAQYDPTPVYPYSYSYTYDAGMYAAPVPPVPVIGNDAPFVHDPYAIAV